MQTAKRDAFGSYHPLINFIFFAAVIVSGMVFLHPVLLGIAFLAACCYAIYLRGIKAVKLIGFFILPLMLVAAVLNPLFNHQGLTVLGYIGTNPWTLEATIYGICSAFMFATIILWFYCYNEVMTSDKFMYLFGRLIPGGSLIFSMVLRFIPKYRHQMKVISNAQKCVGRDVSNGNFMSKMRYGTKMVGVLTTWGLENAVDTADSMKARGYGLPGRTNYSLFRFDRRDRLTALIFILAIFLIILGAIKGQNTMVYYPLVQFAAPSPLGIVIYIAYGALCFVPVFINVKEDLVWKHLQSAM